MAAELSEHEQERYTSQIERLGIEAQLRLKASRSIVIGVNAAGSTAAAHLASHGVGYVAVVDGGDVMAADLCAQSVLYTPDLGANRAEAVAAKLGVLNPEVRAESYPVDAGEANAVAIVTGHDVVLDCRDGLGLGDACRAAGVALVVAAGTGAADGLQAAEEALALLAAPAPAEAPA